MPARLEPESAHLFCSSSAGPGTVSRRLQRANAAPPPRLTGASWLGDGVVGVTGPVIVGIIKPVMKVVDGGIGQKPRRDFLVLLVRLGVFHDVFPGGPVGL